MLRTVYGQVGFATLVIVVAAAVLLGGRTERGEPQSWGWVRSQAWPPKLQRA